MVSFQKLCAKFKKVVRRLFSVPYKYVLGYLLCAGLRVNLFQFPSVEWPPPTPARKYIDFFLKLYEKDVQGRCVEFTPGFYETRFNKNKIVSYDIWGLKNDGDVTIVGDLQSSPHIPDAFFDTIICTHVLCCVPKPWLAVDEMYRILSQGGLVLCTNPVVLQGYAPHPGDYWRFTKDSMTLLFSRFKKHEIHSYGNAATVAASPFYLMGKHMPDNVIYKHDELCPSVIAIAAWK